MDHLTWMDWAGLGLAAYGLAAGAVRGLIHQSTRLLMLVLALGVAGLLETPARALLEGFLRYDLDAFPELLPLVQTGLFVLAALGFLSLRRWLFPWTGEPRGGAASRLLGALLGLGGALLGWTVLLSALAWAGFEEGSPRSPLDPVQDEGYRAARHLVLALERVPAPPRPRFLEASLWPDRSLPRPSPAGG